MQTAISLWLERTFAYRAYHSTPQTLLHELFVFTVKNALSCLFPVFIFVMLFLTQNYASDLLPRYDLLFIVCLLMQIVMVATRLETRDELKVICLFHALGLMMEIFKVHHGFWSYPSFAYTKIFGVPLFSGFMYASVASFITQSWRYFRTEVHSWPRPLLSRLLGTAIYLNFFTNAYMMDIRWILIPLLFMCFWKTRVSFTTTQRRSMPITLSFLLICFFIWIAENIATFLHAWEYTHQKNGWSVVHLSILSSWFLLVIVSFILVTELKRMKER
jgi:uncharacterized membrane protein YoaT (DUF817 family)